MRPHLPPTKSSAAPEIVDGEQFKDAVQLVAYLKSADSPPGPVLFRKARWLAFQCNIKATDIYVAENAEDCTHYYQQLGVTRFVVSRILHDPYESSLTRWVKQSGDKLVRRFENDSFTVYEFR